MAALRQMELWQRHHGKRARFKWAKNKSVKHIHDLLDLNRKLVYKKYVDARLQQFEFPDMDDYEIVLRADGKYELKRVRYCGEEIAQSEDTG